MAPLPAPAEKPSKRVSESQSHAKLSPPAQVAVFCAAPWPNLQPALTVAGQAEAVPAVPRNAPSAIATTICKRISVAAIYRLQRAG